MPSEEFYTNLREFYRLRRLAFPEHYRELKRKSYPNRNLSLQRERLFRYNSSKKGRACRRRYELTEKGKLSKLRYERANPAIRASLNSRRRARSRKAFVPGCNKSVNRIYNRARELKQWFNVVVDHIIPLAKGGLHEPSNLQIIYQSDNSRKHDNLNYKPSVIFT